MSPALAFISSSGSLDLGDLVLQLSNLSFQILRLIVSPHATKAASPAKESRAGKNHDHHEDETDHRKDPPSNPT